MYPKVETALKERTCVLLCGGQSLRMRFDLPATNKVLAEVGNRPLLHHILDHYQSTGLFKQVILCLGNDSEIIRESVFNSDSFTVDSWKGMKLTLLDTGLRSTATFRLKEAIKYVDDTRFFVAYADVIASVNVPEMLNQHEASNAEITMALVKARMPYGRVLLNNDGMVYDFIEKPVLDDWINAGFFIVETTTIQKADANLEFESELFPRIVREGRRFFGYKHNGFWKGVDTYKDLVSLRDDWKSIKELQYF